MQDTLGPRRVLVSGASGLIGSALVSALRGDGIEVRTLVRREPKSPAEARWQPATGEIDVWAVRGVSAVVHFSGENIAQRWTDRAKRLIRDSRLESTSLLCRTIAAAPEKPQVLVSTSAVGFYGDRGEETVDESSPPGSGFLASVCRQWEAATEPAQGVGVRVVHTRMGVVLSPDGGMLQRLLPVFRLGAGGRLGAGQQWLSWIAIFDAVRAIRRAIDDDRLQGAVNLSTPNPVRNAEFTQMLARVLHRPAVFPVPPIALRLAMGSEMANEALLGGQRVRPKRLLDAGFEFEAPTLESALHRLLKK